MKYSQYIESVRYDGELIRANYEFEELVNDIVADTVWQKSNKKLTAIGSSSCACIMY